MRRTEQWTDIRTHPPQTGKRVSVCCEEDGWVGEAIRGRDNIFSNSLGLLEKVTHWKDLPLAHGWDEQGKLKKTTAKKVVPR